MNDEQRAELEAQLKTNKQFLLYLNIGAVAAVFLYLFNGTLLSQLHFLPFMTQALDGIIRQVLPLLFLAVAITAAIFRRRFQSKVRSLQIQLDNDAFNKGIAAAQQIQAGANPETVGVIPATTQQYSASLEDAQVRLANAKRPYNIARITAVVAGSGSILALIGSIFTGLQCMVGGTWNSDGYQAASVCSSVTPLVSTAIGLFIVAVIAGIAVRILLNSVNQAETDVALWRTRR